MRPEKQIHLGSLDRKEVLHGGIDGKANINVLVSDTHSAAINATLSASTSPADGPSEFFATDMEKRIESDEDAATECPKVVGGVRLVLDVSIASCLFPAGRSYAPSSLDVEEAGYVVGCDARRRIVAFEADIENGSSLVDGVKTADFICDGDVRVGDLHLDQRSVGRKSRGAKHVASGGKDNCKRLMMHFSKEWTNKFSSEVISVIGKEKDCQGSMCV